MAQLKFGVAGCGRMGLPMAQSLAKAGLDVQGFDIRPAEEFGDFASHMNTDITEFANRDAILTVVRDIAQTEALLFDEQALLKQPKLPRYLVICSTLSPRYVKELSARVPDGVRLVDAPMSGAVIAAEEARLAFMIGGNKADIDALWSGFEAMGKHLHIMGGYGTGMTSKVLNNFVAAASTTATRKVLDWADELGVDPVKQLALMHVSSGQTWFGSNFEAIEFARHGYETDNSIGILRKDVESMLDAVDEAGRDGLPSAILSEISNLKPREK